MSLPLGDWKNFLETEFRQPYMKQLNAFVQSRRNSTTVYPEQGKVFTAFQLTAPQDVKVVILGQDPYIGPNEAHGLSFSTESGKYTPSLRKIAHALGNPPDWDNNLTRWATQGVFLLNRVLTVDKGFSNSHASKGWEEFSLRVIQYLDRPGMIFLLWGAEARKVRVHIKRGTVIEAEHPVAASYQGREWKHNDCFNKANELLTNKINW